MKRTLRVFFAGKVDPASHHASPYWRDDLAWKLNISLSKYSITDTSLVAQRNRFISENDLPLSLIFSQCCFYIQQSDLLVVNLTDDISIGGSQEIFIAKQFGIPVIGIAARGGKFNQLKYELGGKTYWNWIHPFVSGLCDLVVQDTAELADAIDDFENIPRTGLAAIESAVNYYQQSASALDTTINDVLSFRSIDASRRPAMRIYFAGKMGKQGELLRGPWRESLAAMISEKSHFQPINLDFIKASHPAIDEGDDKLIFGRDTFLIRSSDAVIVNLSDDISIGGTIEMMLAKLYHRPLIGIAKQGGKFIQAKKYAYGRTYTDYVNPFVSATCDWLVHDYEDLPSTIDNLFMNPVKSNHIIPASAAWYKNNYLPVDKTAQLLTRITPL